MAFVDSRIEGAFWAIGQILCAVVPFHPRTSREPQIPDRATESAKAKVIRDSAWWVPLSRYFAANVPDWTVQAEFWPSSEADIWPNLILKTPKSDTRKRIPILRLQVTEHSGWTVLVTAYSRLVVSLRDPGETKVLLLWYKGRPRAQHQRTKACSAQIRKRTDKWRASEKEERSEVKKEVEVVDQRGLEWFGWFINGLIN